MADVTAVPDTSPVPDAQNPNDVDVAPGAMAAAQSAGVTVTVPVVALAVPLHDCVMAAPCGSVKVSRHDLLAALPVLVTVNDLQKPVAQVESRLTVAVSAGDPGVGAGVGAGAGVGVGVGAGVGLGAGVVALPPVHSTVTLLRPWAPLTQRPVSL